MDKEIICPMLSTNTITQKDEYTRVGTQPVYCLEDHCAWWNENRQKCTVALIDKNKR